MDKHDEQSAVTSQNLAQRRRCVTTTTAQEKTAITRFRPELYDVVVVQRAVEMEGRH
jgi:hypothetical protein